MLTGFEAELSQSPTQADSGQEMTDTGQSQSQLIQIQLSTNIEQKPLGQNSSSTGHAETAAGQDSAPSAPPPEFPITATPPLPEDLQELISAWTDLPAAIRASIVSLVRAVKRQ